MVALVANGFLLPRVPVIHSDVRRMAAGALENTSLDHDLFSGVMITTETPCDHPNSPEVAFPSHNSTHP